MPGQTQPLATARYTEGPIGARALGTTYKLPARGEAQGASDGADVKITNLLNEIDKRKAEGWNGIGGLVLSNNGTDASHDIDIATGWAMDATRVQAIYLASAITKRIDANWSAGTGNGGFPSALTLSAATWYHVFLILNVEGDSGTYTVDAGFDTSLTATNLLAGATGYDYYRRIGSVLTDGSANILAFTMVELPSGGRRILKWADPPLDVDTSTLSTSGTLYTLSVPTGVRVIAETNIFGTNQDSYVSSPDANDEAPSISAAPLLSLENTGGNTTAGFRVLTDTSARVRGRGGAASTVLRIATLGWEE